MCRAAAGHLADALRASNAAFRQITLSISPGRFHNDIALALADRGAPTAPQCSRICGAAAAAAAALVVSPPGAGIYLSSIVRMSGDLAMSGAEWPMALLTLAAGVAVAEAVRSTTGLPVELKWPNDLVIGRPWRKLAGVLCESVGVGARVDAIVVGIGVNLRAAAYPPELAGQATSIEIELGRPIERAMLVAECLGRLADSVRRLRRESARNCPRLAQPRARGIERRPGPLARTGRRTARAGA